MGAIAADDAVAAVLGELVMEGRVRRGGVESTDESCVSEGVVSACTTSSSKVLEYEAPLSSAHRTNEPSASMLSPPPKFSAMATPPLPFVLECPPPPLLSSNVAEAVIS